MSQLRESEPRPAPATAPGDNVTAGAILLLMVLTALGQLATNIVVPSLGDIARDVSLPSESTGLILAMVLLGLAFGQLLVGPLSDALGRRPVLLAGLVVYLLGSVAATFAPSGSLLLAARMMQGLGASAGLALPRAIARDRYKGAHFLRAMSLLTMAMSVMPGLAPVLGGLIGEKYGWRTSLGLSIVAGLAALAATLSSLAETHHDRKAGGGFIAVLGGYGHVLRNRSFVSYAIVSGAAIGGAYAEVAVAQRFYSGEFGWSAAQLSLATASYAAAFLVGSLGSSGLGGEHRLVGGLGLMIVAPVLLIGLRLIGVNLPWTMLAFVVLSQIGMGFMMAIAIGHALMAVDRAAGTASAVLGALHMVVGAGGATLVAALPMAASWSVPFAMLGFAVLAVLARLAGMKRRL